MSWTQEDVDALKGAIGKGAASVKIGDEMVTFRTLSEMRQTLAMMEAEVAGPARPSAQVYPQFVRRPQ
ncbi:phage head-tail joining protein [Pararhodobacter zhoushanensis]|uniref:Uncharacterized protein n=1 Tax=Pararhodobacter zhoushanensis TaxID=2479545 RepID=A0ABT3H3Z0_9RHOB|nr:hypothetical protein [Pararhodobacter zhoushanensis]MCW1934544.1 hypothetical protein [Pararhodobacter zhoushanensis]